MELKFILCRLPMTIKMHELFMHLYSQIFFHSRKRNHKVQRMNLITNELVILTTQLGVATAIRLDLPRQRVYWIRMKSMSIINEILSTDYDGKEVKPIRVKLSVGYIFGMSANYLYIMDRSQRGINVMNIIDSKAAGKLRMKKPNYFKLMILSNSNDYICK